jgi:hypothetical protein
MAVFANFVAFHGFRGLGFGVGEDERFVRLAAALDSIRTRSVDLMVETLNSKTNSGVF